MSGKERLTRDLSLLCGMDKDVLHSKQFYRRTGRVYRRCQSSGKTKKACYFSKRDSTLSNPLVPMEQRDTLLADIVQAIGITILYRQEEH